MGIRRRRGRIAPVLAAVALLLGSAATPSRSQVVHATADYLARMDADRDGRVSLAEYQAWMGYGFDAMDRDHDGVLSAAELPGRRGGAPLARDAHRARLAANFARQDHDHDGFLNARELAAPP